MTYLAAKTALSYRVLLHHYHITVLVAASAVWLILADVARRPIVDVQRQHGLICTQAPSRIVRHNVMNDIIVRSLPTTGIPASKEPTGLTRLDGKRPDGLILVPWQGGMGHHSGQYA